MEVSDIFFSFIERDYNKLVLDRSGILLKKGYQLYSEINFILDVSEKIPLRKNSIPCIIMNDALHHFQNHDDIIHSTYEILNENGCLLINDFDYDHFLAKIMFLLEFIIMLSPNYISLKNLKKCLILVLK